MGFKGKVGNSQVGEKEQTNFVNKFFLGHPEAWGHLEGSKNRLCEVEVEVAPCWPRVVHITLR